MLLGEQLLVEFERTAAGGLEIVCLNFSLVCVTSPHNRKPFDMLAEGFSSRQVGRKDLNLRLPAPKAGALAKLSYAPKKRGYSGLSGVRQ